LCSPEKDRIAKSYAYIRDSLKVLKVINAADGPMRLVVHIGSQCKQDRGVAIENCKKNLLWVIEKLQKDGLDTFLLCVETMGRYKTIGNVQEICDICKIDKHIIPTIDFGHVNAWEQGSLSKNPNRITEIMQYCCDALGDRMSRPHIHFSAVTYTSAGEHAHTILDDTKWSFAFEPLAKFIKDKRLEPIIICESKGQMAVDAKKLFDIYSGLC
jgi:deoxyribonuclease-4